MKTLVHILSMALLLGATACGNSDNKATTTISDKTTTAVVDDKTVVVTNEEAIVRRSARMDDMTSCIRVSDADTWKKLSLTTDQIRWMEQLQGRMTARNEQASASVNKDANETSTYTFSNYERRRFAEILTDEQLDEWMGMCPDHGVVATK